MIFHCLYFLQFFSGDFSFFSVKTGAVTTFSPDNHNGFGIVRKAAVHGIPTMETSALFTGNTDTKEGVPKVEGPENREARHLQKGTVGFVGCFSIES